MRFPDFSQGRYRWAELLLLAASGLYLIIPQILYYVFGVTKYLPPINREELDFFHVSIVALMVLGPVFNLSGIVISIIRLRADRVLWWVHWAALTLNAIVFFYHAKNSLIILAMLAIPFYYFFKTVLGTLAGG
jgi:hypothetical protein